MFLSISLSYTHTHTHTQSLSLSLCRVSVLSDTYIAIHTEHTYRLFFGREIWGGRGSVVLTPVNLATTFFEPQKVQLNSQIKQITTFWVLRTKTNLKPSCYYLAIVITNRLL